jgi:hypothetical protein
MLGIKLFTHCNDDFHEELAVLRVWRRGFVAHVLENLKVNPKLI